MEFREKIISLSIFLLPSEQRKNYKEILLKKLKVEYEKKAFQKYGIINSVKNIENISYEIMMRIVPTVHFVLDAKVELYLPKVDDVLILPISKILSCGIFFEQNCFRVLITNVPRHFRLTKQDNHLIYTNSKNGELLETNNLIKIRIVGIRFEKTNFHCLADFIEKAA